MGNVNFDLARFNMVEQQIRTWEVFDHRVLDVLHAVPRELFVPTHLRNLAYADLSLPLDNGQTMMSPMLAAKMLQALNIQHTDSVLEIGTGSGYSTALLARLCKELRSVDCFPDMLKLAAQHLKTLNITNATLEEADVSSPQWNNEGPYDVIALTGSVPVLPERFKHNLRVGGRLFAVIGEEPLMEAKLITRVGEREWVEEVLFETMLAPLLNIRKPVQFTF
ncbi:MAG: protein-L-isoaspartate O-methyltransferase [Pseudomonadota bacterium]